MKLAEITHFHVHMDLSYFQGHGFKGQGHKQHFTRMHFSGRGNGSPWFAI